MAGKDPASPSELDGETAKLIVAHAREYAIVTMNLEGEVLTWSPGAEKITGFPAEEVVGRTISAIFVSSDRAAGEDRAELERAWRDGRVEDSRWHLRRDGSRFWANGVTMAIRDRGPPRLVKVIRDETTSRLAEDQRVLLLNELNHRINNTLATVQALVEQTLRGADADTSVREDLTSRLQALSRAHALLMERNWAGAELSELVARAISAFEAEGESRFDLEGPSVRLSPQQAVSFSLALHELCTNAVKYGALSVPGGRVSVAWNQSLDDAGARRMTFLWAERGGPPVLAPTRRGFGSRLLERSFPDGSGGAATMEFLPEGARCTITLNLSTGAEGIMDLATAPPGKHIKPS